MSQSEWYNMIQSYMIILALSCTSTSLSMGEALGVGGNCYELLGNLGKNLSQKKSHPDFGMMLNSGSVRKNTSFAEHISIPVVQPRLAYRLRGWFRWTFESLQGSRAAESQHWFALMRENPEKKKSRLEINLIFTREFHRSSSRRVRMLVFSP